SCAHHLGPLGPFGIADTQRDGATHRVAVTDTTRDRQLILLELHARTAAIAELASLKVVLDVFRAHGHARRQALHDGDEFGAVRFAGSKHTKHSSSLP